MKWFDSLLSKKNIPTKLSRDEGIERNHDHKSYRDIRKRSSIRLSGDAFQTHKDEPFSWERFLGAISSQVNRGVQTMNPGRWALVIFLLFLAYVVYGLGFLIRTEDNLQSLIDDPAQIVSEAGQHRIRDLFRDYQIVGLIANNPLFPLEPLATYGNVLRQGRLITNNLHTLIDMQGDITAWRESSHTRSIFPVMDEAFPVLANIAEEIHGIKGDIKNVVPEQNSLTRGSDFIDTIIDNRGIWYDLLGKKGPTRLLLLNQNSDELRAGGGFPGTAFIIEFDGGRMTRFQFYDIYAIDWQLKGYRPSPEGINQFRSREYAGQPAEFEIRDANYFPTFHESAKKIDEFMREANFGGVDLVIGINQKLLEDIIHLVEPLTVPGIPVEIDHYNAMLVVSMLVEGKKSVNDKDIPKGSVKILAKALFQELQNQHKLNQAFSIVAKHIFQGEIVLGSPRADVQNALDDLGIFDRWRDKKGDWLYPIFTSISRNKSDRLMERTFEIDQVSSCERIVTLFQKHWYDLTERNRIQELATKLHMTDKIPALLSVQGAGDNVQYLRFILPPGTKYLPQPKSAFSVLETTSLYTSIHGYETTKPGTTATMSLRYILPEGYCDERTEFFKQPGLRNTRILVKRADKIIYQTFYE